MTFNLHTAFSEAMLNFQTMLKYSLGYYEHAKTAFDSTESLSSIKRAYYSTGNYYKAAEYQQKLIDRDSSRTNDWMAIGSYKMMSGEYEPALAAFNKADELDTTNQMVSFNLALYYSIKDENDKAREILINNVSNQKGARAQGETRVRLANILNESEVKSDLELAAAHYNHSLNYFLQSLQSNSSVPSLYMWAGIAYLGLHDYGNAINYLHSAEFMETRPFYQGMIYLWLGKAYLANDEPEQAREFFSQVLTVYAADYHQTEARKYLDQNK